MQYDSNKYLVFSYLLSVSALCFVFRVTFFFNVSTWRFPPLAVQAHALVIGELTPAAAGARARSPQSMSSMHRPGEQRRAVQAHMS